MLLAVLLNQWWCIFCDTDQMCSLVVSTTFVMPLQSTCLSTDCKVTNVSHRCCACQQIATAQRFKETTKITPKTFYQAPMNLVAISPFHTYFQWKCELFLFSVSKMIYDFVCICWNAFRWHAYCIWCFLSIESKARTLRSKVSKQIRSTQYALAQTFVWWLFSDLCWSSSLNW